MSALPVPVTHRALACAGFGQIYRDQVVSQLQRPVHEVSMHTCFRFKSSYWAIVAQLRASKSHARVARPVHLPAWLRSGTALRSRAGSKEMRLKFL